ncbi:S-methyl-5-thioribose-1-phosphate isomerase [Flavilitoribacter nigricans]|uniref:Methylthioribose-1-phosphate isomerase n=1 Tax=Flavilitoribacter nigricans (strain ATCC 23147 / DSM 23189 / NBRC 102662 / NCIMB 1420 / SS-2) TaxID=1122177 RepID=A0A2D0NEK0_FLAN2|nr:S-methyl-5-thioribose-1-phosphate isomerase [Flavilitoribacter nigricans]PHN06897.1 S-methyl-5-thioribose-1-phosphate isomerase [Flavilitoribacter nigricans DSM 23189 = NBRC 102662]
MKIEGQSFRSIWVKDEDETKVQIIDQRYLPFELVIEELSTLDDFARAIREMHVRGAPLIGATAAYGLCAAIREMDPESNLSEEVEKAVYYLRATRPTAVDLQHATETVWRSACRGSNQAEKLELAKAATEQLVADSILQCQLIGEHGVKLIEAISKQKKGETVNILTHCNAGWLACIDHGTATAPIYAAHDQGIKLHVWVDETRPRNQGANLTAYELAQHGVPHTVIVDNTGGHLMQHGMVDLIVVGTDRTTRSGDVANKIGTYLKALAAKDNGVPFYVAAPSSSIDWQISDGLAEIPIEERTDEEVKYVHGWFNGRIYKVLLTPHDSPAANYGFDVTPARLVSGLITERGVCAASENGLSELFPEMSKVE